MSWRKRPCGRRTQTSLGYITRWWPRTATGRRVGGAGPYQTCPAQWLVPEVRLGQPFSQAFGDGRVAGRLPAQDGVPVQQHEQLGVLRGVTAQQHRRDGQQPPGRPVRQGHDHADMLPGPNRTTPTCADDFSSGTGWACARRPATGSWGPC